MNFEKFEDCFHDSWKRVLKPFIESPECDKIYAFLKQKSSSGATILPKSSNTWNSFFYSDYNRIRCIILLMDPYNQIIKGTPVANGIPMDCSNTGILQPSLELFYKAIEDSECEGLNLKMDMRPSLQYLLDEGVFLLNSALTVEEKKPGSHAKIWEPFIKWFFEEVINKYHRGIPIVFVGKQAQKYEKYVSPMLHYTLSIEHPAAASYNNQPWDYGNMFQWVNHILQTNNGHKIKWYREVGESDTPF